MKAKDFVTGLLNPYDKKDKLSEVEVFAPTNIALVKYWGKRDVFLNLPLTSSFSVTLPTLGTTTKLSVSSEYGVAINNIPQSIETPFSKRLIDFLELFDLKQKFYIQTSSNIPIGAGLASSASGFAALVMALDQLYGWNLSSIEKSLLARLGSGSACRSFYKGFVEWEKGNDPTGVDSHAISYKGRFNSLVVGVVLVDQKQKPYSSTKGMILSAVSSPLMSVWDEIVSNDLIGIKQSITIHDFKKFGKIAQTNALSMHAVMQTSYPPLFYTLPQTLEVIQKVLKLQEEGHDVYFTQDAGPNIKLLFQKKDLLVVQKTFQDLLLCFPFDS